MKNKIKKNKYIILFVLVLLSLSIFSMVFVGYECDYFWHIKAGEYMVKNNTILTHDVFSWFVTGKYWFSHEWLFEKVLYNLLNIFGNLHIYVYCFILFFTLLLSIFVPNRKEYLKNIPFCMLWFSFSAILFFFLQARPHLITYVLISLLLYILFDLYKNEDSNKFYFIPIISLIWVNVHGGSSSLVYIFPIIFFLCGIFSFKSSKIENTDYSRKKLIKYMLSILFAFIPLFINPHGYKMVLYPYQNMNNSVMLESISEWHCSDLNSISHYPFFVLAFLIFMIMFFSKKKIRLIDALIFLFGLYLGLKSIRFWPFIYIFMSHSIFYYISPRKVDKGTDKVFIILICLFLGVFCLNKSHLKLSPTKVISDKAIDVLKKENPKRLLNYYDYGGYLVYKNIPVFIDGRADLYSEYNFEDYLDISNASYKFTKYLKKYNFDYILMPKKRGITTYLSKSNDYNVIYSDKKIVIFKAK